MSEVTPEQINKLTESINKLSGGNSSAKPATGGSPGVGYFDNLQKQAGDAASTIVPMVVGFKKFTEGADVGEVALKGFNAATSAMPAGLRQVAGLMGDLGGAVLQQKKNMDAASATLGIGNNDIGKFVRMAGEAGVTTEQFTTVIKNSDGAIAGMGGTAQKSAENFSKLAKDVQSSQLGQQMTLAGVSAQEMAEYTALSMVGEVKKNMADTATREKAAASAAALAQELDATSKLTGQSREALAKSIAAEEKKPNVTLAMLQMSEKEREGYKKTQEMMVGMGPGFQSLATEFVTGGVRTKEGMAQMAALGPAGTQYEKAVMAMKNATTDGQKAEAQRQLEAAQVAINQRMASKDYNQMLQTGTDEMKRSISAQVEGNKTLLPSMAAAGGDASKLGEAMKGSKESIAKAQQGLDEQGKKDPGQESARLLNEANRRAMTTAGGMAQNFEKVNNELGKFISGKGAETIEKTLTMGVGKKGATMDSAAKDQEEGAKKLPGQLISAITGKDAAGRSTDAAGLENKVDQSSATGKLKPLTKKAEGGDVEANTPYLVGEKGPEIIKPKGEMEVVSTDKVGSGAPKASATVSATATPSAPAPSAGAGAAAKAAEVAGTGPMSGRERVITTDWADATQKEIKEGLDSAKQEMSRWSGKVKENEEIIADLKRLSGIRQLSTSEDHELKKAAMDKGRADRHMDFLQTQTNVLSNLDAYKAKLETENKEKTVTATQTAAKIAEDIGIKQVETTKKTGDQQQMVLTDHQQTTLKYAYQDAEGKKMQLENAKNLVNSEKNFIDGKNKDKEAIEKAAAGRELTNREKSHLERLQKEIDSSKLTLSYREQDLAVYSNLDKLKTESATESAEEQQSIHEDAAAKISEITQLSANTQQDKHAEAAAKISEVAKTAQAQAIDNANVTVKINGKVVDPNSPEAKAVINQAEAAKAQMNKIFGGLIPTGTDVLGKAEEAKNIMTKAIGGTLPKLGEIQSLVGKPEDAKSAMTKAIGGTLPTGADLQATLGKTSKNIETPAESIEVKKLKDNLAKLSTDQGATTEKINSAKAAITSQQEHEKKTGPMALAKERMEGMFGNLGPSAPEKAKLSDKELKEAEAKRPKSFMDQISTKAAEDKKSEEAKKTEAAKTEAAKTEEKKAAPVQEKSKEIGMKELNDQLIKLNSNVMKLISHSETTASASEKTARATSKATGNRSA